MKFEIKQLEWANVSKEMMGETIFINAIAITPFGHYEINWTNEKYDEGKPPSQNTLQYYFWFKQDEFSEMYDSDLNFLDGDIQKCKSAVQLHWESKLSTVLEKEPVDTKMYSDDYLSWLHQTTFWNLTSAQHKFVEFLLKHKKEIGKVGYFDELFLSVKKFVKK